MQGLLLVKELSCVCVLYTINGAELGFLSTNRVVHVLMALIIAKNASCLGLA